MGKWFHMCLFNQYAVGIPGRPFPAPTLCPCAWLCGGGRSTERLQEAMPTAAPLPVHGKTVNPSFKIEGQEDERE